MNAANPSSEVITILSAGLKYPRKSSHVHAVLKTIAFEGIYDVNDSDISLLIYELHEAEEKARWYR